MPHRPWLWPNRKISKAESGQLREEHNAAVNRIDELEKIVLRMHRARVIADALPQDIFEEDDDYDDFSDDDMWGDEDECDSKNP